MAKSNSFPLPITKEFHLNNLCREHEIDRAVRLDLASTHETSETVRTGYCEAHISFFEDCSLSFPIPEDVLDVLAELGLSFTHMCPNFLRHLLTLMFMAREEGLLFGLDELCHLCLMKRNNKNPGTFVRSPRPGRHIVDVISYHDEKWREHFFVFKVNQASVGNFDFSKLYRKWAEDIG